MGDPPVGLSRERIRHNRQPESTSCFHHQHANTFPYIYDLRAPELTQSILGDWVLSETFDMHQEQIHGCAVHPALPYVATASWDVTCKIYDTQRHELISTLEGVHTKGLYAVEFSKADHAIVGTVSSDCTCQIWDVAGRHLVSCGATQMRSTACASTLWISPW